jgi:hypothetical protein
MFTRSTPAFVIAYLALMVPTYLLPYLGSNSSVVNTFSASTGMGLTIPWYLHVWCLAMLVILSWVRGRRIGKSYLPVFPVLAGVFDMVPGLSLIPLIPTVLHILAIVLGAMVKEGELREIPASRGPLIGSAVATVVAVTGMAAFEVTPERKPAPVAVSADKAKVPEVKAIAAQSIVATPAPTANEAPKVEPTQKPTMEAPKLLAAKPPSAKPRLEGQARGNVEAQAEKPKSPATTVRIININD